MIIHHLPGEGQNTAWYQSFNPFEAQETTRQVKFKRARWPGLPDGAWAKNKDLMYPHILPDGHFDKALFDPIAGAVQAYCSQSGIAWHTEALNLRSSQVCCFNVMFPLMQDLTLAAVVLSPLLPGVKAVYSIEFEYTGTPGATAWLGEPAGGRRGQNRTSIDVAVWWTDGQRRRLTLGEWKYTEKSFGDCGGYKSKGNSNRTVCEQLDPTAAAAPTLCYLTQGKHHRNYWKLLAVAGIDAASFKESPGCPFRGPFYQVMRQFLVAAHLRQKREADLVDVAAVLFHGNDAVVDYTPEVQEWNRHLVGVPPLRLVYVDDIVAAVRKQGGSVGHAAYLLDRYGV